MLVKNPIKIFLENLSIILCYFFHQTYMNISNITIINNIIISRKIIHITIQSCLFVFVFFFTLLAVKSSGIFPKQNEYGFISESFVLN